VARRRAATRIASSSGSPATKRAISASSRSASCSIIRSRARSKSASMPTGTGSSTNCAPMVLSIQRRARRRMRSMTPRKLGPTPQASWMATGLAASRVCIMAMTRCGSAPSRSHLLMKAMRGTP
jgi:hypothetical protein